MTSETKYIHICEVCGRREILTAEEGYEQGWDYPPETCSFGVIMPRKCGSCSITETLWWALAVEKKPIRKLHKRHWLTLHRILEEPDSITVSEHARPDDSMGPAKDDRKQECE